jgi:hypothetical protein
MTNDVTWEEKAAAAANAAPRRSGSPLLWLLGGAAAVIAGAAVATMAGLIDPLGTNPVRTMSADFGSLASGMRTDQNWANKNDYMAGMVKNGKLEVKSNTTLFIDRKIAVEKDNPLEISITGEGVTDEVKLYAGFLAYDSAGKALTGAGGKPYLYAINGEKPKPGAAGASVWTKTVKLDDFAAFFGKTAKIADARAFLAVQSEDGSFDPVKLSRFELK